MAALKQKQPYQLHVAAEPGIAKHHDPSTACWCGPQRTYPLADGAPVAYLHRGAQTTITRFSEEKR